MSLEDLQRDLRACRKDYDPSVEVEFGRGEDRHDPADAFCREFARPVARPDEAYPGDRYARQGDEVVYE